MLHVSWPRFIDECHSLSRRHIDKNYIGVYGVPTGGCLVALQISRKLNVTMLDRPFPDCLVVFDIVETSVALEPYRDFECDAIFRKSWVRDKPVSSAAESTEFIRFPWESEMRAEDALVRLIEFCGANPLPCESVEENLKHLKRNRYDFLTLLQ